MKERQNDYDIQQEVDEIVWEKDMEHLQKLWNKAKACGCRQCWWQFEECWESLSGVPWKDIRVDDTPPEDEGPFAWG